MATECPGKQGTKVKKTKKHFDLSKLNSDLALGIGIAPLKLQLHIVILAVFHKFRLLLNGSKCFGIKFSGIKCEPAHLG